jgi:hypothetical protein
VLSQERQGSITISWRPRLARRWCGRQANSHLVLPNLEDPADFLTPDRLPVGSPGRWPLMPLPPSFDWVNYGTFPRLAHMGVVHDHEPLSAPIAEVRRGYVAKDILEPRPMQEAMSHRFGNGARWACRPIPTSRVMSSACWSESIPDNHLGLSVPPRPAEDPNRWPQRQDEHDRPRDPHGRDRAGSRAGVHRVAGLGSGAADVPAQGARDHAPPRRVELTGRQVSACVPTRDSWPIF